MALFPALGLVLSACVAANALPAADAPLSLDARPTPEPAAGAPPDAFGDYLSVEPAFSAGFSDPLDRGWVAEEGGAWRATSIRSVRAMAAGVVDRSDPGEVRVRHRWIENFEVREVTLVVTGGTPVVADGAVVAARAVIATGTRVNLRLEGADEAPSVFASERPWAPVPAAEAHLALISHDTDELRLYRSGREVGRYEVGFGQAEGQKLAQGDNRSPKGVYFITQKSTGPFGGPSAAYFGGYWMRVNYPNAFDAARAAELGWISPEEQRSITRAWRARKETTKRTRLGGGIGLHGWAYEWEDEGSRAMSWGCIVMHLRDAPAIYAEIQEGTMVILF